MRKSFKITLVILATLSITSCKNNDDSASFKKCMDDRHDREFCGGIYSYGSHVYAGTNRIVSGSGGGMPPRTGKSGFTAARTGGFGASAAAHGSSGGGA